MSANQRLLENSSSDALQTSNEIELQEVGHISKPDEDKNQEEQNLLESFQNDDSEDTDIDLVSVHSEIQKDDARLDNSDAQNSSEVTALHDRINRNLMGVGSSSSANTSENPTTYQDQSNENTTHSRFNIRDHLTFSSLRNNFNFLDRVYRPIPANRPATVGPGSDGVFSNLSAKPETTSQVESDTPPTYDEVSQDQTPPYWENSVVSPGFMDEVFIDGLPVGNIVNFVWNVLVSASFQFVGFLLTYLLHTSHAAKQGSRAGLGITFITYGFSMIPKTTLALTGEKNLEDFEVQPEHPNEFENVGTDKVTGNLDQFTSSLSSGVKSVAEKGPKVAHLQTIGISVMILGILILVKALLNYHRAKKMEETILQPPQTTVVSPEEQV